MELIRFANQMALFATVAGVRYCWRQRTLHDYEALRAVVAAHGGAVSHRRRRAGVLAIVAVVLVASLAGGIAAWLNGTNAGAKELASARAVNLTLRDLPNSFYATEGGLLSYLVPSSKVVYTSTTTTPTVNHVFDHAASLFQHCLGVTNAKDRIYGAAGQEPDYQVSSKVFDSNALGGVEVASTTQYYHTTLMVKRDTHEMTMTNFGSCFAESSADLVVSGLGAGNPKLQPATNWRPKTFLKGWVRGGYIPLTVSQVTTKLQLVQTVVTHGHYEVTLTALVGSFTKSEALLSNLASTLLSRTTTSNEAAA